MDPKFTTLCLPICFCSLSLPQTLGLRRVFCAMLRKQNAVPAPSLLLVIFKSPQKLPLSSVANAFCLWKQFQFTFYNEKKSTASKALQVSTLFSCIVFLTKKEFFGTTQALSGLHSLFFNPSQLSNSGFQAVTFPFREGQLVILGWISQSIVLRFLPRCSAAKPLLPLPLPVG